MDNLKLHSEGKNIHRDEIIKELKSKIESIIRNNHFNGEEQIIQIKKVKDEYAKKIKDLEHNLY